MRSDGMNRDVKVVCIGDSITEGYGVEAVPGSYPEQLERMLGEGFQVYNQGVSCTCTTCRRLHGRIVGLPYILEKKWEEALSIPGDIYIVMLGTNDAQNGYNEEEDHPDEYNDVFALRQYFQVDYKGLLKKIRDARPGAEVFSVKPPPIMDSIWRKHKQEYLEDILNRLDEIWKTESYLHGIDVQEAFLKLPWKERRKLYQADGCHPNGLGAELIARTVAESVRRLTANP